MTSHLLEVACNDRSWVLRQGEPVPRKILRLVGILAEEIEKGLEPKRVFAELNDLIQDAIKEFHGNIFAVAHFARLEQAFLDRLWRDHCQQPFPIPIVCTHKLAKLLYPRLPNYGLRALAGWFGMPLDDGKRASNHVKATKQIWQSLEKSLEDLGVNNLETLMDFLGRKPVRNSGRRDFQIPREKRLALPSAPGVYRYVDRSGRVLYVGKATSLKSRVNSYFTGGCRGDHRKLEMLAQAVDVEVTTTKAPIFAGLLEYDEIRRLTPPYNIAFKGRGSDPLKGLEILIGTISDFNPEKHSRTVRDYFPGLGDLGLLKQGIIFWRSKSSILPEMDLTERDLLRQGIPLLKIWIADEKKRHALRGEDLSENDDPETCKDQIKDEVQEIVWTAEMIASVCDRIVRRAIRHYIRSKWLKRIAGASITLTINSQSKGAEKSVPTIFTIEQNSNELAPDLRRIRVLLHELRRAQSKGGTWEVTRPWSMNVPFWI